MESPILYEDLEDEELKSAFDSLFHCIGEINDEERLRLEVTANPTLSRVTYKGKSILFAILDFDYRRQLGEGHSQSIIKFMIQMNPSALLWKGPTQSYPRVGFTFGGKAPIFMIVHSDLHCILMPWIAANYSWVLDHEEGKQSVFELINHYKSRNHISLCTAVLIKQFFEAHPRALRQNEYDENFPLHTILSCTSTYRPHSNHSPNCDVELFKWMAKEAPDIMSRRNRHGQSPLHIACVALSKHTKFNMNKICKYLITECPDLVQLFTNNGSLSIHVLLRSRTRHHPLVRDVIVCLLREHPESYQVAVESCRVPSSFPFIRHIKPLLDGEKELMESANQLRLMSIGSEEMPGTLSTAVGCTNKLAMSTADVFNSWATSFVRVLDKKVKNISPQLDHACIHFDDNGTTAE